MLFFYSSEICMTPISICFFVNDVLYFSGCYLKIHYYLAKFVLPIKYGLLKNMLM